jgi:hypothetical protein
MERTEIETWVTVRRGTGRSMTLTLGLMCASLVLGLFLAVPPAPAQQGTQSMKREALSKSKIEPVSRRAQFAQAISEYKGSLEKLVALYEADVTRNQARVAKMKELCSQGLITSRDIGPAEEAEALARVKLVDAEEQLKDAGVQLGEAAVEVKMQGTAPKLSVSPPARTVAGTVHTTAYIRYSGGRAWSLAEVSSIKQFFALRFGRALPIHVFGQSPLHDRWGYDHRNAIDIGLNPNSVEGQALIEHLRANGIPFTAFHFAIPGVATGPHIHVGLPSLRIASTSVAANPGNILRR